MSAPLRIPDALVLAGGGTLGEAWMRGLLAGAEAQDPRLDFRTCEYFVGTSAGSIVAAMLSAGRRPEAGSRAERAYAEAGEQATPDPEPVAGALARIGAAVAAPLAPVVAAGTAPGGAFLRRAALAVPSPAARSLGGLGHHLQRLGATFDGRLRVTTVDRGTGKRVVFGAPGAPRASVADAVLASCSIPWVFKAVRIAGREYVDGGVWSPTNLDAVPAMRGGEVLCLNPTGAHGVLRAFSVAAAGRETLLLRGRGVAVRTLVPDARCVEAIGPNFMDRGRVDAVLDAAYAQGRRLSRQAPAAGTSRP